MSSYPGNRRAKIDPEGVVRSSAKIFVPKTSDGLSFKEAMNNSGVYLRDQKHTVQAHNATFNIAT